MKKMMVALVAMFVMATSVNAQSDNGSASFDRMASYLELTIDQVEQVRTAMAQFDSSMAALYQNKDASKGQEAWDKIRARHMATMKKILSGKQYEKYVTTFDLTAKNTAERLAEQLEYEKRQQLHGHKGESPERLVRNEETMPF